MKSIIIFALFLTLAAAIPTHPLLSVLDDELPDDVKKCVEAHGVETKKCLSEYGLIVMKHLKEIEEHAKDPENLKETTKKDICCSELVLEDCMLEAVKSTPGCTDILKKFIKKEEETEQYKKMCGTKYARGGPGCK
jgi:hypothetical protein